jgi:glucose-6-phosphate isomerase
MTRITKKELTLLNTMIKGANDRMGGACCNDLDMELMKDWTLEEKQDLAKEIEIYNKTPEEYDESRIGFMDWMVFGYLYHKLLEDFHESEEEIRADEREKVLKEMGKNGQV